MNSIQALDFAIARLDKIRTPRLDVAQQLEEAITTLRALREHIAEQNQELECEPFAGKTIGAWLP